VKIQFRVAKNLKNEKMKQNLFILCFTCYCLNCSSQNINQNASLLFARIITYDIIIKDTSSLKYNLNYYLDSTIKIGDINVSSAQKYIDHLSVIQFSNIIKKYMNDKNAFAIKDGKKVKSSELIKGFYKCDQDSIATISFDENGNEYTAMIAPYCDSNKVQNNIMKIRFIESWSIDNTTYEFKKEVLAFTLFYWDDDRELEREALTIYKNSSAYEKIKSFNN
jgi:hypothetical protein